MRQAGIPTADYRVFRSAPDAEHYVALARGGADRPLAGPIDRSATPSIAARPARRSRPSTGSWTRARCSAAGVQVEIEERGQKRVFTTAAEARDFVLGRPVGLVLKADGLAAGKGVFVCDNLRQALEAIDQIMVRRIFGQAGDRLIIEERLDGQETSVLA